ncbi:SIR2 family protein [Mycobacterium sp. KBS0706]|uniref:SIR2 family protein n=1 Tax=Mycobacterium sp. KBS0706 TaxID=2578109 RepID=UPI00110F853F|nr:SIR2 family protein [Mycobacterium sp. KBS0706]TSD87559.1 SIR2 family protein [Mycobacterium sp. KBS0706]
MTDQDNDWLEQLDRHLASPCLAWLLGAGVSYGARIPLMYALTSRINAMAVGSPHEPLIKAVRTELPDSSHIEHLLSHLGDYAALAERSRANTAQIDTVTYTHKQITDAHEAILGWIATTIRWGYIPAANGKAEEIGAPSNALTRIDEHSAFVAALFNTAQAGLQDRRRPVRIFTTNYDTLIEDAIALAHIPYWDGFSGGAIAFRSHRFGQDEPKTGIRACVVKLHGSIDWHLGVEGKVWRVRDLDFYPARRGRILIHPQATKYAATQRDPFAAQFDLFRRAISGGEDNVLAVCGYSFGDDHINQEIELCMASADSRTTLVAFIKQGTGLADCLERWKGSQWGSRVYVVTEAGLYVGNQGPFHAPGDGKAHNWWTFEGVTKILRDGAEGSL